MANLLVITPQVVKRCMQLVDVVAAEVAAGFDCLDHEWIPKRQDHSCIQQPFPRAPIDNKLRPDEP